MTHPTARIWGLGLALLTVAAGGLAQKRPFDADLLVRIPRLSSSTVSPDGREVAYVLRTTDMAANRGRTDLWSVSTQPGTEPRRLTSDPAADWSPIWALDGSGLLFLSTRSGSSQVWFLPRSGGEAVQLTDLPLDVANLSLSPDGERLAFTMEVFPDCDTLQCSVDRGTLADSRATTGVVYDDLFVRHWDRWEDGRRSHLFVLDLDQSADEAQPRDLMVGMVADTPSMPFGGGEEITWTPDGQALVFTSRAAEDSKGSGEAWSTNHDLWLVPADGSEPPRNLTANNPAWDTQPLFASSGATTRLLWTAMRRPGYESDRLELTTRDWPSGTQTRKIASTWDRSIGSMHVANDGRRLFVTASDLGETGLFEVELDSGDLRRLTEHGWGSVRHVAGEAEGGSLVVERVALDSPNDLWLLTADGPVALTSYRTSGALAEVEFGQWQQFSFAGWNDEPVHGYTVWPKNLPENQKVPVAFLIHGGPQGSFSNNFHYRWNPQTYVGAGYAVVMIDFHGSTGYGQDFTDSIQDDWGGKPLEDLQKGLAAALERYDFLDGDRVCALGASYGGFMVNWIAGNWADRFDCLVNHDGVFDQRMMYYSTEELWFPEREHRGTYFENAGAHERHNPALHVDQWKTPMLVIHGALDYRIPDTQGIAAFTALQRRGIPSRFLWYPDENHWVLQPKNSVQWHREVERWLAQWLGSASPD